MQKGTDYFRKDSQYLFLRSVIAEQVSGRRRGHSVKSKAALNVRKEDYE